MVDSVVSIPSGALLLSGVLRIPDDVAPGERRPAVIVLHGFGSNTKSGNVQLPMAMLSERGYITLGFDMRGCGESGGEPGYIRCLDQVEDTKAAVSFLAGHANVEPARIALLGSSFGAAVAVYTGGVDPRVAAVISSGGWGDGVAKFRDQHSGPGEWDWFLAMLERGRVALAETGVSPLVPRWDIVPIPPHLRTHLAEKSVQMFPIETAQSMYDFIANDVIGDIAPRPVLLLHSSNDSVTPTQQSVELFKRAKQPCDLHLFAETDHFMFNDQSPRVRSVLFDWLDRYFPVTAPAAV
jgi:alpha-beta hydrolase superfamily lysophospholipase